jgi:hypothetical protein
MRRGEWPLWTTTRRSIDEARRTVLADQLRLDGSKRLLDVGCGPGAAMTVLRMSFAPNAQDLGELKLSVPEIQAPSRVRRVECSCCVNAARGANTGFVLSGSERIRGLSTSVKASSASTTLWPQLANLRSVAVGFDETLTDALRKPDANAADEQRPSEIRRHLR